ncbi:unnamed protein product [Caenorhabditis auriculariae]|uniref:SXP/RAL-2 family protein Ani s 5-like cation-binding domain-containing protein n=1 Tax=Caenorhabditis auriculariae TaxID=2777116 RepID=A0A8S1HCX2_9PELO|nr:unnamed protein product [Caenorhabditis auriculariae]
MRSVAIVLLTALTVDAAMKRMPWEDNSVEDKPDFLERRPGPGGPPERPGPPGPFPPPPFPLPLRGRGGRRPGPPRPPLPSFLRKVSFDGRRDFFDILGSNETIAQQNKQFNAWAEKYNVSQEYSEFVSDMTQKKAELSKNIAELVSQLPDAQKALEEALHNEQQTRAEQHQAIKKVVEKFPQESRALFFLSKKMRQRPEEKTPEKPEEVQVVPGSANLKPQDDDGNRPEAEVEKPIPKQLESSEERQPRPVSTPFDRFGPLRMMMTQGSMRMRFPPRRGPVGPPEDMHIVPGGFFFFPKMAGLRPSDDFGLPMRRFFNGPERMRRPPMEGRRGGPFNAPEGRGPRRAPFDGPQQKPMFDDSFDGELIPQSPLFDDAFNGFQLDEPQFADDVAPFDF